MMKTATRLKTATLATVMALGTMTTAMAADYGKATTIEYVTFQAKDGVAVDAMASAAAGGAINANLTAHYDGFVDRHVSLQDDGVWVEVVYWESQDAAKAALEKFLTDPVNTAFLDLVNVDTVAITYSAIK